jgi:L-lysine exporter family protein LysE/ArgO
MIAIFTSGFALGLSLIVAIGAQNAFVLKQGLRGQHVLAVVLTCAISDAILVTIGVAGFGAINRMIPWLTPMLTIAGATFLFIYGAISFGRAIMGGEQLLAEGKGEQPLGGVVATCLALTWLNPHVYLDTVVLLGAISTEFGDERWLFGLGAVLASFVFFFSLGYCATFLSPVFARPRAWRILEFCVGIIMWSIALKLILT